MNLHTNILVYSVDFLMYMVNILAVLKMQLQIRENERFTVVK